jgi:hypothetical protein
MQSVGFEPAILDDVTTENVAAVLALVHSREYVAQFKAELAKLNGVPGWQAWIAALDQLDNAQALEPDVEARRVAIRTAGSKRLKQPAINERSTL